MTTRLKYEDIKKIKNAKRIGFSNYKIKKLTGFRHYAIQRALRLKLKESENTVKRDQISLHEDFYSNPYSDLKLMEFVKHIQEI